MLRCSKSLVWAKANLSHDLRVMFFYVKKCSIRATNMLHILP